MRAQDLRPADLARAAGATEEELWHMARNTQRHYFPTRKKPIRGKVRELDEPRPRLKAILQRIHRYLECLYPPHPRACGGVSGRSYLTSAQAHAGARIILTRDVEKCYPSTTAGEIRRALLKLGFRSDVAKLLSLLFTCQGRLPQGSPASSDAINLLFADSDHRLASLCGQARGTYTRVIDDFVISVNSPRAIKGLGKAMELEIASHGLAVNAEKRLRSGLQVRDDAKRVHKLRADQPRPWMTKEKLREILQLSESYILGAKAADWSSLEALGDKHAQIQGHIATLQQIDPKHARHCKRLLRAGDETVARILHRLGFQAFRNHWWYRRSASRQAAARGTTRVRSYDEPKRLAAAWRMLAAKVPVARVG